MRSFLVIISFCYSDFLCLNIGIGTKFFWFVFTGIMQLASHTTALGSVMQDVPSRWRARLGEQQRLEGTDILEMAFTDHWKSALNCRSGRCSYVHCVSNFRCYLHPSSCLVKTFGLLVAVATL
jgi:hypothetical protein